MKDKSSFWFAMLTPLVVGALSGLISKKGMDIYEAAADKPALSPPSILFPIVWTILYLLLGYSLYRVLESDSLNKRDAVIAFSVGLILNFLWSPIFFNLQAYTFASIILVALIIAIIIMAVTFYKADRLAGYLQIPYLLWLCFALYLNIATSNIN
ncbi:MAG: tryptophan-rich sensory protein [Oscillospiraceae bacterium]|nr:tryptophan-rich sensory protein [Oscillospiraceae bacterium]